MNPLIIAVTVDETAFSPRVSVTYGNGWVSTMLCPKGRGREVATLLIPDDGKAVCERQDATLYHRWVAL